MAQLRRRSGFVTSDESDGGDELDTTEGFTMIRRGLFEIGRSICAAMRVVAGPLRTALGRSVGTCSPIKCPPVPIAWSLRPDQLVRVGISGVVRVWSK